MTRVLIMMCGVPGSGKTTFVNSRIEAIENEGYYHAVSISRDAIRFSMLNDNQNYFDAEDAVFEEFIRQINEALELGIDYVYVDATHISEASRRKVLRRLKPDPQTDLSFLTVICPCNTAIKRNAKRTGRERVPDDVIKSMSKKLTSPIHDTIPDNNYGFKNVFFNTVIPKEKEA